MVGYKVCWRVGRRFISYAACYGECEYAIGETTTPRKDCGPLCLFDALGDLCRFLRMDTLARRNHLAIFDVEYEPDTENTMIWDDTPGSEVGLSSLPKGTQLAKSVTLIRELTKKEILDVVQV